MASNWHRQDTKKKTGVGYSTAITYTDEDFCRILDLLHDNSSQLALKKANVSLHAFVKHRRENSDYDQRVIAIHEAKRNAKKISWVDGPKVER